MILIRIIQASWARLALARTDKGICDCRFLETDPPERHIPEDEVLRLISHDFPGLTCSLDPHDPILCRAAETLEAYLDGRPVHPEVPLDLSRGTPFQRRVWKALCRIPYGETASYAQIAATVGSPRGARAVGGACGKNPVAIAVPCHRVIASNGALGGYSAGISIKKRLLQMERRLTKDSK